MCIARVLCNETNNKVFMNEDDNCSNDAAPAGVDGAIDKYDNDCSHC